MCLANCLTHDRRQLGTHIKKYYPPVNQKPEIYLAIFERRVQLLQRIETFRVHQKMYMPSTYQLLHPSDRPLWHAHANYPEDTLLFMPSEIIPTDQREQSCIPGLPQIEVLLREEELRVSMEEINRLTRVHTIMNQTLKRTTRGLREFGRARRFLNDLAERIVQEERRKRYAEDALLRLDME